jgi:diguanylate cyclase (GGDEF)-like protein
MQRRRAWVSWEDVVATGLQVLRLESIRSKILAFALLATLIPSVSTAWVSYLQNKRALTEKISHDLQTASAQISKEMDLWLKSEIYNLRVFSTSPEVAGNVARLGAGGRVLRRVNDYLASVRRKFPDYENLVVVDPQGRVIAGNAHATTEIPLPADWLTQVRNDNQVVGAPYRDGTGKTALILAYPLNPPGGGRMLGALAVKLNLRSLVEPLRRFAPRSPARAYFLDEAGALVAGVRLDSVEPLRSKLATRTIQALAGREGIAGEFRSIDHVGVVGTLAPAPALRWSVLVEIPTAQAFLQVARLRNTTALILTVLLGVLGLLGYFLGVLIVRPLNRLTSGAAAVAAGHLDVDLPVVGGGEVGYLTQVFNNMVTRLREGRQALERLSVTDSLTGLYNRRYLTDTLGNEVRRSLRLKHHFAVLLADVDRFKRYNDAHGHLAGDEVLKRVAAILRETAREVDTVARYGGEEFLVLMPETDARGAAEVAERIRQRLAGETFTGGTVTISIGTAEFPEHGDTPESLIAMADAALYQAKDEGRDRVVRAGTRRRSGKITEG